MAVASTRSASPTKSDAVPRPRPGGIWRFDLDYTQFQVSGSRITLDLRPTDRVTAEPVLIKAVWALVNLVFTGETTIELDVGQTNGDANEYLHAGDLTGSGTIGQTQAERGTASDGRNAVMLGDLLATVDLDTGSGTNLTAGGLELFVAYEELDEANHPETPHAAPTQVSDPGRGTVL
jgi:hypothetical protein